MNNSDAPAPDFAARDDAAPAAEMREFAIINRRGLHARATAKLVQCIERYNAEVTVGRCGETVGGTSIMGILTLGAGVGSTIIVTAKGVEAREVLTAIATLIAQKFGEDD